MWVLFKLPIVFDDENRANLTTPTGFSIEPSSIPGAGLGAWAKVPVRMFSVIGEYEGDEHTDNEASTNYQWNVRWCVYFIVIYKRMILIIVTEQYAKDILTIKSIKEYFMEKAHIGYLCCLILTICLIHNKNMFK